MGRYLSRRLRKWYAPIFSNDFIIFTSCQKLTIISISDEESSKASNNSSRRNSDAYDSDGSVRSLESIEKVLQRRNKMRTRVNYDEDDETSDSDSDDDGQSRWDKNSKKRKKFLRNGGDKRPRVVGENEAENKGHILPIHINWGLDFGDGFSQKS